MVVLVICRGFVLVSLLCIVGTDGSQCGQRKSTQEIVGKRIVGGEEAKRGSWPWMVMLTLNGNYKCGGSIIATRAILTAAHCVSGEDTNNLRVIVGKHHKTTVDDTEQSFLVEKVVIFQNYDNTSLVHDVALLILQESLTYTQFIQPVCLPSTSMTFDKGIVIGWGETKGTGYENVLKEALIRVSKSYAFCINRLKVVSPILLKRNFCAGSTERDACYGDSGGPFNSEYNGHWYITGIVSTGVDCAQPGHPGIYVKVSTYVRWINFVLTNNNLNV